MPENAIQKDTKQIIILGLLLLCCFLLASILLNLHKNNQVGRYIIINDNSPAFYVLDTQTSHVWYREPHKGPRKVRCFDLGTLDKPNYEESMYSKQDNLDDLGFIPVSE
jgi:hypothetical protein